MYLNKSADLDQTSVVWSVYASYVALLYEYKTNCSNINNKYSKVSSVPTIFIWSSSWDLNTYRIHVIL